jgi:hypothetical protein
MVTMVVVMVVDVAAVVVLGDAAGEDPELTKLILKDKKHFLFDLATRFPLKHSHVSTASMGNLFGAAAPTPLVRPG